MQRIYSRPPDTIGHCERSEAISPAERSIGNAIPSLPRHSMRLWQFPGRQGFSYRGRDPAGAPGAAKSRSHEPRAAGRLSIGPALSGEDHKFFNPDEKCYDLSWVSLG